MEKLQNKLGRFLRGVDMFGIPNSLIIGTSFIYRSKFSGFISLWVIIGIIILSIFQLNRVFEQQRNQLIIVIRGDVSVRLITKQSNQPDKLFINTENVFPAFRLEQLERNFIMNPLIQIKAEHVVRMKQIKTNEESITSIRLEPCSLEHFGQLQTNLKQDLILLNITDWLCPAKNAQYSIQGSYGRQDFEFIRFSIYTCLDQYVNAESNYSYTTKCGSEEEFKALLSEKNSIKIQFVHLNYVMTPEDTNQPAVLYIDNDQYFEFNPKQQFIQYDHFFRNYVIKNHDNLLNQSESTDEEFIMNNGFDYRQQVIQQCTILNQKIYILAFQDTIEKNKLIAQFIIRRSPYTNIAIRQFPSLIEVLSYVGGLISIIFTFGNILMSQYNEVSLLKTLANNCYNYSDEKKYIEGHEKIKQMIGDKTDLNDEVISFSQVNMINKLTTTFKIQLKHACIFLCQCKRGVTVRRSIYSVGMEMIYRDLNSLRIVRALHDIERIKKIILTDQQLELFNFLPKPLVAVRYNKKVRKSAQDLRVQFKKQISELAEIHPNEFQKMFQRLSALTKLNVYTKNKKQEIELDLVMKLYSAIQKTNRIVEFENKFSSFINKQILTLIDSNMLSLFQQKKIDKQEAKIEYSIFDEFSKERAKQTVKRIQQSEEIKIDPYVLLFISKSFIYKSEHFKVEILKFINDKQSIMTVVISIQGNTTISFEQLSYPNIVKLKIQETSIIAEIQISSIYRKISSILSQKELEDKQIYKMLTRTLQNFLVHIKFQLVLESLVYRISIMLFNIKEQFFQYQNSSLSTSKDIYFQLYSKQFSQLLLKYKPDAQNYLEIEIGQSNTNRFDVSIKKLPSGGNTYETEIQIKFFMAMLDYIMNYQE